jgi:peptidoglycan/xylan/chitin deacetylase (PgdA/CDA1 family)
MRGLKPLIYAVVCGVLAATTCANAAECPGNPGALGTSRTIVVDPLEHPRIGSMQYRETLPLEDHEVVLTFDDGPILPYSARILDILASECVKATYFMVGEMARRFPGMVRRIHDAGHTIGTHSEAHPLTFQKMPLEQAEQQISDGIASVSWALGDPAQLAPFFRIPGFLRSDAVEAYLASQHLMTWGADFPADDWMKITPAQVYARALERIEANHKGVLLLHDIHERTVEALPLLLGELKLRGYRIVHVVPATAQMPKTASEPRQWLVRAGRIWPQVPVIGATDRDDPELPAPSPASLGLPDLSDLDLLRRGVLVLPLHQARGRFPLPPVSIWPREVIPPVAASPLVYRPQLSAPSPQSFGAPDDVPASLRRLRKTSIETRPQSIPAMVTNKAIDLVPEVTSPDVHRLMPRGLAAGDGPTGSLPQRPGASNIMMPHGAFP